jgi:spore coat protein CotH
MNWRWLHVGMAGWVAWWAWVGLAMGAAPVAAETVARASADDGSRFFGLTNLWEIHLTLDAKAWGQMQSGGGPRRGMGGGRPGLVEGVLRGFLGGGGRRREASSSGAGGAAVDDSGYPWGVGQVEIQGEAFTNVSVRFKGVSSMVRAPNAFKRPFRVDLERGVTNRRFMGVPEFVLNNNVNDATQMREVLAYDAFRRAGLPAPRTAFARVYLTIPGRLTRQHLGLYTVVEPVDRAFLRGRFQTDRGLLLKPDMMRGLAYLGDEWAMYAERYQPKGKVDPADAGRFVEFVRTLRMAAPDELAEEWPRRLDPVAFARFVGLNALLANVDSFIGNGHNYYLFQPAGEGRLSFIPWDLNEAFGMHPVSGPSGDQMVTSVIRPNADPNNLVERFLATPSMNRLYRAELARLLDEVFDPRRLAADIDRIAAVTQPVVTAESRRAREDFERTVLRTRAPDSGDISQPRQDLEAVFVREGYEPWGFPDAVFIDNMPLKDWIEGRARHVRDQLEGKVVGTRPRPRL